MSTKINPLADYVVAQPDEVKAQTASGFFLPENATEKPKSAVVTAVGKEVRELKVGDRILYKDYGPMTFRVEGKELLLIKEDDVLATIN